MMIRKIIKILGIALIVLVVGMHVLSLFVTAVLDGGAEFYGKTPLGYRPATGEWVFWGSFKGMLNGVDGPYLIRDTVFRVNEQNKVRATNYTSAIKTLTVPSTHLDSFIVPIQSELTIPNAQHELPDSLIVISDIEGNFVALSSFLVKNKVIDDEFNWQFGDGHLVLNGDFVDRGEDVCAVLWLIYKLEQQAIAAGGMVHFIIGNHEVMNLTGDVRYVDEKYTALGKAIEDQGYSFTDLYGSTSHFGQWLMRKNIMEKIGPYLFVHAGVAPEVVALNASIEDFNKAYRAAIKQDGARENESSEMKLVRSTRKSPFWYRGMVMEYKSYQKMTDLEVDAVLAKFDVKHVVIGHTVVNHISTDYDGKVIRVDVKHGSEKNSSQTQGLLIIDGKPYVIDGAGQRRTLLLE